MHVPAVRRKRQRLTNETVKFSLVRMVEIVLVIHNLRSCYNVGALLRTADGTGVAKVYLTGYTPYPLTAKDNRLPYIAQKINHRIHKTALGAEQSMPWNYEADVFAIIDRLRMSGFTIAALEQHAAAIVLPEFRVPQKVAVIVGREVEGVEMDILSACDICLEIPMHGQKESFNVAAATAMALYHFRFTSSL